MLKKLVIVAVVLVVILIVVVVGLWLNLGRIVKMGVEKGGSKAMGVPVTLESAGVSLLAGSATLKGLTMGGPEGFEQEMFNMQNASATVELRSLMSDEIVVKEVLVDRADVTLEFAGLKTNWGKVMATLKERKKKPSKKRIRIDRIVFKGGSASVAGLPGREAESVELPGFEIEGLKTKDGGGLAVPDLLMAIVGALRKKTTGAAGDVIPTEQLERIRKELGPVLDSLPGDVGGSVKDGAKKIEDTLGGVLGGTKEEDEED